MQESIKIEDLVIDPGQKFYTWLKIAEDCDGPVRVPFLVANGRKTGKCLYIVSGINGDNFVGMEAIYELFKGLNPENMKGRILAIPMLNFPAFIRQSRVGPDGMMLNRTSGGNKKGCLTEKIAYAAIEKVACHADYALEIITGTHYVMTPFVALVKTNKDSNDRYPEIYLQYAKSFGSELLWMGAASETVLRNAIAKKGVKIIQTQIAGQGYCAPEHIDYEVQHIKNLLIFLGIIDEKLTSPRPNRYLYFDNFWLHSHSGGIFRSKLKAGQMVKKGERLATINNMMDQEIEVITAPHEGVVIGYRSLPRIFPGDWSVWVANIIKEEPLKE